MLLDAFQVRLRRALLGLQRLHADLLLMRRIACSLQCPAGISKRLLAFRLLRQQGCFEILHLRNLLEKLIAFIAVRLQFSGVTSLQLIQLNQLDL